MLQNINIIIKNIIMSSTKSKKINEIFHNDRKKKIFFGSSSTTSSVETRKRKKISNHENNKNDIDMLPDIEDCILIEKPLAENLFEKSDINNIQNLLLTWYDQNRRTLPWRGDRPPFNVKVEQKKQQIQIVPPYYTWVSEIMCQQTKVTTVIEYFTKWISKFPTIEALANASAEEVNLMWSGLGYYRRARFLHKGAKTVMEEHNGKLPNTIEGLKSIPGIGDYTAGAIGSIAYNIQTPLVDGNVIRVFSRIKSIAGNPKNKKLIKLVWDLARITVDPDRPGDFNQSLMELGATLCTPKSPDCHRCPVSKHCSAYKEKQAYDKYISKESSDSLSSSCPLVIDCTDNEIERSFAKKRCKNIAAKYPMKARKPPPKEEVWCVYVYKCADKYLLIKRPNFGLLANQWEFPSIQYVAGEAIKKSKTEVVENDNNNDNNNNNNSKANDEKVPLYDARQKLFNAYIKTQLSIDLENKKYHTSSSIKRRDLGYQAHIFSHRKHNMYVEEIHVSNDLGVGIKDENYEMNKLKNGQEFCWVHLQDMKIKNNDNGTIPLTTGMRKVITMSTKKNKSSTSSNNKKKRKKEKLNNSQPKLSQYFKQQNEK